MDYKRTEPSIEYQKLDRKIVTYLREAYKAGAFISDLAEEHDLPEKIVYDVVTRRTWRHVP